jgi:glycosyltransferase involved in cell wall biosynthesis
MTATRVTGTTTTRRLPSGSANTSPDARSRAVAAPDVRRLACYGWVQEQAGSVASANYLVVRELLRRGIEIDFYANREHVPPPAGLDGAFQYLGFQPPALTRALPGLQRIANWIVSPVVRAAWRRVYSPAAAERHRARPYGALLSLGTPPAFTIPAVPTVTWLQGPLHTELEAIRRLRKQIVRTSGRTFYLALVAYYLADRLLERRVLDSSGRVICGSKWSRQALVADGLPPERVFALPYPIDLDVFRPSERDPDLDVPLILSLGRLDPRKRLDLLLAAFTRVRAVLPTTRLLVVGRPGYAPNQLSLLERFPLRAAIDYRPVVPREEVPALLQRAAVLVQASENENFGSAVAEALACGTPVVLGRTNGTADYIDGGSRLFERYAPDSISAAIVEAIESRRVDPALASRRARAAAEASFAASAVVERLLDIVEGAVGENHRQMESAA